MQDELHTQASCARIERAHAIRARHGATDRPALVALGIEIGKFWDVSRVRREEQLDVTSSAFGRERRESLTREGDAPQPRKWVDDVDYLEQAGLDWHVTTRDGIHWTEE